MNQPITSTTGSHANNNANQIIVDYCNAPIIKLNNNSPRQNIVVFVDRKGKSKTEEDTRNAGAVLPRLSFRLGQWQ